MSLGIVMSCNESSPPLFKTWRELVLNSYLCDWLVGWVLVIGLTAFSVQPPDLT
jgi:hypothetical protein